MYIVPLLVSLLLLPEQRPTPPVTAAAPAASPLWRRVHLLGLTSGLLHQNQRDAQGSTTISQLRGQLQGSVRVRLDARDALAIGVGVATGASFRSGWNHTVVGSLPADGALHVKQLYVAARRATHLDLQVGSFGPARGADSELTGLDNDGYLVGERLTLRARKALWLDEIVVTRAYVGDLRSPGAFGRLHRLSDANYLQLLGVRRLTGLNVSAAVTEHGSLRTVAGAFQTARLRGLSLVRFEAATALTEGRASAIAAVAERRAGAVTYGVGGSHVASRFGELNGDRYGAGGRLFAQAMWRPRPELSISLFGSRAVGAEAREPRRRVDVLVNYDLLRALVRSR
jgi:hypothetical protein